MTCTFPTPTRSADLPLDPHGCTLQVCVAGELDLVTAQALTVALTEAGRDLYLRSPRPARGTVQLDLSDLTFLDSSGITALRNSRSILAGLGFGLCLVAPQTEVLRLLECAVVVGWLPPDVNCADCARASFRIP